MKQIILFASIMLASGLLFSNMYNSMIDARSWGADIPASIETARQYFKVANPGDFFRIFSPVNQVLALLALVLFWKTPDSIPIYLAIAFVLYVLCDVLTFAYFYPRNDILFKTGSLTDTGILRSAWSGWNVVNWLRTAMLFIGLIFSFAALRKIYRNKESAAVTGVKQEQVIPELR